METLDWHEFKREQLGPYHQRKQELAEKQKMEKAEAWAAFQLRLLKGWKEEKRELERRHQEEREQFQSDWNDGVKQAAVLWEKEKKRRRELREAGVDPQAELKNFLSSLPNLPT